jgi:hypothetical protein
MRALLVSEGKHEQSGALQTLVNHLARMQIEFELDRVSRSDIHAHHGKGGRCFKRAVRWLGEAKRRGVDALILVIDEDGRRERIAEFNMAQEYTGIDLRRALGVAVRTFDAWMLADEKAFTAVLGYQIEKQADPEAIADPKQRCMELHEASRKQEALREIYASLAMAADIRVLRTRCPKGFAPFASRVGSL